MDKGYKLYEMPEGADPILLVEGKIDVISAKVDELVAAVEETKNAAGATE